MPRETLVLRNDKEAPWAFSSDVKPPHLFPLSLLHQVYNLCHKPIFRLVLDRLEAALVSGWGSASPATMDLAPQ